MHMNFTEIWCPFHSSNLKIWVFSLFSMNMCMALRSYVNIKLYIASTGQNRNLIFIVLLKIWMFDLSFSNHGKYVQWVLLILYYGPVTIIYM